jgi:hypothetical protein
MTDPAIIEAAARAIAPINEYWAEYALDRHTRRVLAAVTPLIRGAALEAAAKEAEVFSRHENWEVMSVVRKVAASIRAIKEQP